MRADSKTESQATATFKANLQSLPIMLEFVRTHIRQMGFNRKLAQRIEIAIEEALVNVINYAYVGKNGHLELTAKVKPRRGIQFIIKDNGIPFNPLDKTSDIDLTLSLEEREVGGLGLKLMKEFMDEIAYERSGDLNILTLVKKLS